MKKLNIKGLYEFCLNRLRSPICLHVLNHASYYSSKNDNGVNKLLTLIDGLKLGNISRYLLTENFGIFMDILSEDMIEKCDIYHSIIYETGHNHRNCRLAVEVLKEMSESCHVTVKKG